MNKYITQFPQYLDVFIFFIESSLSPKRDIPIVIGNFDPNENKFILYNSEQLSRTIVLEKYVDIIKKTEPVEIWDYSFANIEILKSYNIHAIHVPLKSPSWYIDKLLSWRSFDHDVGFCGSLSHRRIKILEELKYLGKDIIILETFGEERDKALAKCKIIINIHYAEDYNIFESSRCEPWIKAGYTVVSENSLDNDDRCINVKYDELCDTIIKILEKQ
jgi:hypothetical protein